MTKHGFLDKIKTAAATIDSKKSQDEAKLKDDKSAGKWDALKDDFMMKPKKVIGKINTIERSETNRPFL